MGPFPFCEGLASRQTWLLAPPKWGPSAPTTPMGRALRLSTPGSYLSMRGASPLGSKSSDLAPHSPSGGLWPPRPPWGGRSAPPPRVTFPSRGKSPKARQGLRPLESPEGDASLPLRRGRNPLDRASDTEKDRFATFTLEANRSFVLSKSYRGNTFYFQSVARGLGEELG